VINDGPKTVSFVVSAPERTEDMIDAEAASVELSVEGVCDAEYAQMILKKAFGEIWMRDDVYVLSGDNFDSLLQES